MPAMIMPWKIGGLEFKNRLVRSATWEGAAAPDGFVTDKLLGYYRDLSAGEIGAIISGFLYVCKQGKGMPFAAGIDDDDKIEGLTRMAQTARQGGAKIIAQIVHAGGQSRKAVLPEGEVPVAPSAHKFVSIDSDAREMTLGEIEAAITAFGDAALRAKLAGFDAVQLHGAHGYLISEFLSPRVNKREDEFGGSPEKRFNFVRRIIRAAREKIGSTPLGVKMNCGDFVEGGLSLEEALQIAKWYADEGLDFIEVSGGVLDAGKLAGSRKVESEADEGYFFDAAKKIKALTALPVISVGGWKTPRLIESALAQGIDAVSLSRPLIREPHLAKRWKEGDLSPSTCVSCNGCRGVGLTGSGVYCAQLRKQS